jgi:hypothetical protein
VVDAEAGSQPAAATLVAAADDERPQVAAVATLQVGVEIEEDSSVVVAVASASRSSDADLQDLEEEEDGVVASRVSHRNGGEGKVGRGAGQKQLSLDGAVALRTAAHRRSPREYDLEGEGQMGI